MFQFPQPKARFRRALRRILAWAILIGLIAALIASLLRYFSVPLGMGRQKSLFGATALSFLSLAIILLLTIIGWAIVTFVRYVRREAADRYRGVARRRESSHLLPVVLVIFACFVLTAYGAAVFWAPQILYQAAPHSPQLTVLQRLTVEQNARILVISFGGALVVIAGLIYTARSFRLAHRGQITDRFTKSLERLDSQELYVRIGGIHALEHIMRDSADYYLDAVEVLVAFIRLRTPRAEQVDTRPAIESDNIEAPQEPTADIQAALIALARRPHRRMWKTLILDLHELHLDGADLRRAQFRHADMRGTRMRRAQLGGADLQGADLGRADLREANLDRATLKDAKLIDANLNNTSMNNADLSNAYLSRASLRDAQLDDASLKGAHLYHADLQNASLVFVKLMDTDFTGAQMHHAQIGKIDLRKANMSGAQLTSVDLRKADGLDAVISHVVIDESTVLPGQAMVVYADGTIRDGMLASAANRTYWVSRSSQESVELVDQILALVNQVKPGVELGYLDYYIGLASDGVADNFLMFWPTDHDVAVNFRIPRSDEVTALIDDSHIFVPEHDTRSGPYRIRLTNWNITLHQDLLLDLIHRASRASSPSETKRQSNNTRRGLRGSVKRPINPGSS